MFSPNNNPFGHDELLRYVDEAQRIYTSDQLHQLGLGRSISTAHSGYGPVTTREEQRIYQASCGCPMEHYSDLGTSCPLCRVELEALNAQVPQEHRLNCRQLDDLARACRRHTYQCHFPFCGFIGCFRHTAQGPDEQFYCPAHHQQITYEVKCDELRQTRGRGSEIGYRFWRAINHF